MPNSLTQPGPSGALDFSTFRNYQTMNKNYFTIYRKQVAGRVFDRYYKNYLEAKKQRDADFLDFENAGIKLSYNSSEQAFSGEVGGFEIELVLLDAVFSDAVATDSGQNQAGGEC